MEPLTFRVGKAKKKFFQKKSNTFISKLSKTIPDLVLILKHVGKQFFFLMPVKSAANCDAAFTDKSCKRRVKESWSVFLRHIFSVVAPPTTSTISPFVDDDRLQ